MDAKVGCCGFPESRGKYYSHFKVVEIQQSFYQLPKPETARKWREEAPEDFEFTLKAWQLITHEPSSPTYRRLKERVPEDRRDRYGSFKPTEEVLTAWIRTEEIAQALRAKVIVFQCPASFRPTDQNKENLKVFFHKINRKDYIFTWEPRGKWSPEEIKEICQELDLVHCVDPFKDESTYGKILYYRLHGIGGYSYQYTDENFEELKSRCRAQKEIYFMFNNTFMLEDALRFKNKITGGSNVR